MDFQTIEFNFVTNEEGVWRTTKDGKKIFIKDGVARVGGPKGKKLKGKKSNSTSKEKPTPKPTNTKPLEIRPDGKGGVEGFTNPRKVNERSPDHLYHYAPGSALEGIASKGLQPTKDKGSREKGWEDDEERAGVVWSWDGVDSENYHMTTISMTDKAKEEGLVVLRFASDREGWINEEEGTREDLGAYKTKNKVKAEQIEVHTPEGWKPITQYTTNQFNFVVNDCGTGKGGFKPGNTCAKGSDGVAGPGSQVPKGFKAANPEAKDSLQRYQQEDGSLTPERSALHDRIIAEFSEKATPVDNPTFVMMGGGSAAGKSNLLNSGVISIDPNSVMVDSDEIKKMIPEYANMVDKNNPSSAAFVHEESSWIASRLYRESLAESKNILLDGTGNNTLESVQRKVQEAKDYGTKVKAFYVTVDTETALERNRLRAQKTGRLVPEVFVRKAHAAVSRILPDLLSNGVFDELELYDTNQNSVRLVVSSKGSEYKIKDETLWNNFKAKANQ